MKKPVLFIFGFLFLAFISVYFIIPQKIQATRVVEIDATDVNISKFLVNKRPWVKWWPGKHVATDSSSYSYKNISFTLQKNTNSEMHVLIRQGDIELNSVITYATTGEGMCDVTWFAEIQSSINPFERVAEYFKIKRIAKDIDAVLADFKKFIQADINVYGMNFTISKIQHPIVLATTLSTTDYPAAGLIYNKVAELKKQISAEHAAVVDSPIMNVHPAETGGYFVTVAVPINTIITPGKNAAINKLVKNANILETQVKGGKNTVLNAFAQLRNYQKAHRLTSAAMPFESLITNRLAEKDTANWVTKIYCPIF
nr:hypothetical protein [Mucilaginibacter sp. L294]